MILGSREFWYKAGVLGKGIEKNNIDFKYFSNYIFYCLCLNFVLSILYKGFCRYCFFCN